MNRLFGSVQIISEIHKGYVKAFVGKSLIKKDRNALEFDFRGKYSKVSGTTIVMLVEDAIELRDKLISLNLEEISNE